MIFLLSLDKARVHGYYRTQHGHRVFVAPHERQDLPGGTAEDPSQLRLFGGGSPTPPTRPQLVLPVQRQEPKTEPEPQPEPDILRPERGGPIPRSATPHLVPELSFPNDSQRPEEEERQEAESLIWEYEQPLIAFAEHFSSTSGSARVRGFFALYRGKQAESIGTHYRGAVLGYRPLGEPHQTPTRASLHNQVTYGLHELEHAGKQYVALAMQHGVRASELPEGPLRETYTKYATNNPYMYGKTMPVEPAEPSPPPTYRSLALSLERASNLPVRDIHMQSAGDVATIFAHLRGAEREKLMAIHVDAENNVQNVECISVGGLTESMANVREVLKAAVIQNTPGLWLLHNHPSGDPTPSQADYDVTKLVHQYGKRLGITLHGHIVVGETHYAHITTEQGVAQHYPYAPTTGDAEDTVPEITVMQTRLPEPALQGKQIRSSADAASIGKELMHGTAQQSYLLVLDQKNKINAAVPLPTTGTGIARQNALNEALRQAILHNGRNCILVSDVDNAQGFQGFTQAFKDSLKGVPITLLDGIRLLPQGHASMADQGLLKALVLYLHKARRLHYRTRRHGLQISIENRKGSIRRGEDPDGNPWERKMVHPYGYVRGTVGMDGSHIDCFVGPHPDAPHVYIVTTHKAPEFTEQDEQKCFLGFESGEAAKEAFFQSYDDARHFGNMIEMPVEEFKQKARATMERPGAIQAVG